MIITVLVIDAHYKSLQLQHTQSLLFVILLLVGARYQLLMMEIPHCQPHSPTAHLQLMSLFIISWVKCCWPSPRETEDSQSHQTVKWGHGSCLMGAGTKNHCAGEGQQQFSSQQSFFVPSPYYATLLSRFWLAGWVKCCCSLPVQSGWSVKLLLALTSSHSWVKFFRTHDHDFCSPPDMYMFRCGTSCLMRGGVDLSVQALCLSPYLHKYIHAVTVQVTVRSEEPLSLHYAK
jgi:hypothetical protein